MHRSDAARLVVLGLGAPSGSRLPAVAEAGVPTKQIAASDVTRDLLDGTPTGPTLVEDTAAGAYA